MAQLAWDVVGERRFETGIDRGVLYLPDPVVWNGLRSVEEKFTDGSLPYYVDGIKYLDSEVPSDFAATVKAITYPDALDLLDGAGAIGTGLFVQDQPRRGRFGLTYRTRMGNDVEGTDHGYQIHILYNVVAVSEAATFTSLSNQPSLTEFGWTILATPTAYDGSKPTAHIILDSTQLQPYLLRTLEGMLYGTEETDAHLPTLPELAEFIINWDLIEIIDNGDGTWTAIGPDEYFSMLGDGIFQITNASAVYLDADTYEISDSP